MKSRIFYAVVFTLAFVFINNIDTLAQGKGNSKGKGNAKVQKKGGPPPWAPAHGYRAKTRYVYFKDHDVYYDHERGVYITLKGGDWEVTAKLPSALKGVDLKAATKIDLDFDGDNPQKNYKLHKKKYN